MPPLSSLFTNSPITPFHDPDPDTIKVADRFDTEPVVGWRGWEVLRVLDFVALSSVTYSHAHWPKRAALHAICQKPRVNTTNTTDPCSHAPNLHCQCGIYARKDRDSMEGWALTSRRPRAFGTVYLWGRLIAHQDGWRGSKAYPKELFLPEGAYTHGEIQQLIDGYGVPVHEVARMVVPDDPPTIAIRGRGA